ncbi:hypothetical protein [Microbulbifer hainanensis]|uniref:hypothetical protein n=1 Tax=Microbulbifer hainanensis TaxID=2735675 RepID=UPI0018689B30|nr:hypothetical protein [Microbulbifer hainanensis]
MSAQSVADKCAELPVFNAELEGDETERSYDLVLKPVNPIDGVDQYWPLFNSGSEAEQFGNMLFKFNGKKGTFVLNLTLDLSEVPDLQFAKSTGQGQDGIKGLTQNFKHEFKAQAEKNDDHKYTKLKVTIKNKDAEEDTYSFLWQCTTAGGADFISGDPRAKIDPE